MRSLFCGTLLTTTIITSFGVGAALAANFTTTVQESTAQKWTDAIWNPGPVAPTPGNTYECLPGAPTRIRNPAPGSGDAVIGVKTFPGDSLTMDASSEIRVKGVGNSVNFPGVGGNPGLIMNGGNIDVGDGWICPILGVVRVKADSTVTSTDAPRGVQIAAQI